MRSLRFSSVLVSTLAASALTVACDDGGGNANPDPTSATTNEPTTATQADTTDTTPDTTEPEPDVPVTEATYPEGPYGAEYLNTIADLGFYDPWYDHEYKLSDYYKSEDTKVILIVSGAGWCTACQYESWDLVTTYDKYHEDGLEVLYTLYEDTRGKLIWQAGADEDELEGDWLFMNEWRENLGAGVGLEPQREANYPTLVDRGFVLGDYYDKAATPLSLIVRTSDMKILYRQIGYSAGSIDVIVKSQLYH